jgi:DNA-binding NtrC family response regulator
MNFSDPHKVVILDEDLHRRNFLRSVVNQSGAVPFFFDRTAICLDNVAPIAPDLVIAGPLPKHQAYRFILSLKLKAQHLPVVVLSGDADIRRFVRQNHIQDVTVLGNGAEPWELEGALGSLMSRPSAEVPDGQIAPAVIGQSPAMQRLKKTLQALHPVDELVFIRGEPGTGKELIARALYFDSTRNGCPFAKIDLAELPRHIPCHAFFAPGSRLKSAVAGNFDAALAVSRGGTLLLDDIDTLPLDFQQGLLGYFDRLDAAGSSAPVFDVRLICTGTDGIEQLVREGKFRKDLYYRIQSISLTIPPLRRRGDDIGLLADYFADECCIEIGRGHFDLSSALKDLFAGYPWPGNVRELKNAVRTAVINGSEEPVRKKLTGMIKRGGLLKPSARTGPIDRLADFSGLKAYLKTQSNLSLKHVCQTYTDRIEKKLIKRTLERTSWNRREAARMLDISYKSILNKIKQYKLGAPSK